MGHDGTTIPSIFCLSLALAIQTRMDNDIMIHYLRQWLPVVAVESNEPSSPKFRIASVRTIDVEDQNQRARLP